MFTGIVEEMGAIAGTRPGGFSIRASKVLEGLDVGDSVSVNGACLTVTECGPESFSVDVVPETCDGLIWAPCWRAAPSTSSAGCGPAGASTGT